MKHYLIEFRFHGYAKKYSKKLCYDVAKKFKVKGVTRKRVVPHISLFGPFTTKNERKMVSEVAAIARKYTSVPFTVKGFSYFDNPMNKVIYLDIKPSEELKELRYELARRLNKVTNSKSVQDRKSKDKFYFHATVAFKDINGKFKQIWHYLKKKEEPNINQHLIRITILKGRRILHEYDLLQKRLLTRRQALDRCIYRKTIEILERKSKPSKSKRKLVEKRKKISLCGKIKSLLTKKK